MNGNFVSNSPSDHPVSAGVPTRITTIWQRRRRSFFSTPYTSTSTGRRESRQRVEDFWTCVLLIVCLQKGKLSIFFHLLYRSQVSIADCQFNSKCYSFAKIGSI